jgi:hypothetical protein
MKRLTASGRSIAVIVGIGVAALLVPIGVQAVTSSVTISDAKNFSSKARVAAGRLEVTATGKVSAAPAPPQVPLWGHAHLTDTNRHVSLAGPFSASNVFKVSELTFANVGSTNLQVRVRVMKPTTGACDSGSTLVQEVETVVVPAGQTVATPFPTPLVAKGPCLTALLTPPPPTGSEMWVTLVGYR